MNTELLGVACMFLASVGLAIPLGRYIARVYSGEKSLLDFISPVEKFFLQGKRC